MIKNKEIYQHKKTGAKFEVINVIISEALQEITLQNLCSKAEHVVCEIELILLYKNLNERSNDHV